VPEQADYFLRNHQTSFYIMDVEQRDEEISRFFTFLFCLLANVVNSQIRAVQNAK